MATATTAELADFRTDLRAALDGHEQARRGQGYDPAVYAQLSEQLGLPGFCVPEEHGGQGCGWRELVLVFEELGRALTPTPLLGSVVAAAALLDAGETEPLPDIAAGTTRAAVVFAGQDFTLDGHVADLVVTADGPVTTFAREEHAALDLTRGLARIHGVAALGTGSRAFDLANLALAAELVGVTARVLEMSVEYATDRVQFGRPIGSFQAIKHKCADMHVGAETSRSVVQHAAEVVDGGGSPDEVAVACSAAKAWCADAATRATAEAIQIHGGIGFTWEHDAHLYYRRATSSRLLLGDPAFHRARMAERLGW